MGTRRSVDAVCCRCVVVALQVVTSRLSKIDSDSRRSRAVWVKSQTRLCLISSSSLYNHPDFFDTFMCVFLCGYLPSLHLRPIQFEHLVLFS